MPRFATAGLGCGGLIVAEEPEPLAPLTEALSGLLAWICSCGLRFVVIGGVAASLLGRPRTTADVDALVMLDESGWPDFVQAAEDFGIRPRIPDALAFAAESRVLLLRHEPSGIDLDVSCGLLAFEEEAVRRARAVEVAGEMIPLPTPEDLIIMKAVARRTRDLADIEAILDAHSSLDLDRVRVTVRAFADVLELPEMLDDLERILRRRHDAR